MRRRERPKIKSDDDLEQMTNVSRNDPLGDRIGTHTRASIERFEQARVPWLRYKGSRAAKR